MNSFSQEMKNNGAIIFTVRPTVIIVNNMNLTNSNSGEIIIKSTSNLTVNGNIINNNNCNIEVLGNSEVNVENDVVNYGTFNNRELSTTRVLGNFINHAFILNEAIIEMGE